MAITLPNHGHLSPRFMCPSHVIDRACSGSYATLQDVWPIALLATGDRGHAAVQMRFGGSIGVHAINRTSTTPLPGQAPAQRANMLGAHPLSLTNPLAGIPGGAAGVPRPNSLKNTWQMQRAQQAALAQQAQVQQVLLQRLCRSDAFRILIAIYSVCVSVSACLLICWNRRLIKAFSIKLIVSKEVSGRCISCVFCFEQVQAMRLAAAKQAQLQAQMQVQAQAAQAQANRNILQGW